MFHQIFCLLILGSQIYYVHLLLVLIICVRLYEVLYCGTLVALVHIGRGE